VGTVSEVEGQHVSVKDLSSSAQRPAQRPNPSTIHLYRCDVQVYIHKCSGQRPVACSEFEHRQRRRMSEYFCDFSSTSFVDEPVLSQLVATGLRGVVIVPRKAAMIRASWHGTPDRSADAGCHGLDRSMGSGREDQPAKRMRLLVLKDPSS